MKRRTLTKRSSIRAGIFLSEALEPRWLLSDVSAGAVVKGEIYGQTSTAVATLAPSSGFFFDALVQETSASTVSSATVTPPGQGGQALALDNFQTNVLDDANTYDSLAALNAAYPDGTYSLQINAVNDGTHTLSLDLAGDGYPVAPYITNFNSILGASASAGLRFTWNALGSADTEFELFTIEDVVSGDVVLRSISPGAAGALTGTATGITVPASTLLPGHAYIANVEFLVVANADSTDYPGVDGAADYVSRTEMAFVTALAAPAAVAATTALPHHVAISWDAVPAATAYQVFRSTTNNVATATKVGAAITTTTFNDTTVTPGVLYLYWVRARDPLIIGPDSSSVIGFIPLAAPTEVAASTTLPHHVEITWDAVAGATSYRVFRNTTNDVNTAVRIGTGIIPTSFNDTNVSADVVYYYWVRALNSVGIGLFSASATGYLLGTPAPAIASAADDLLQILDAI